MDALKITEQYNGLHEINLTAECAACRSEVAYLDNEKDKEQAHKLLLEFIKANQINYCHVCGHKF